MVEKLDITKIKTKLRLKDGFLGSIAFSCKLVEDANLDAPMATDGLTIFYNPDRLEPFSQAQIVGILAHECGHIALRHVSRMRTGEYNPHYWNIASDMVVNEELQRIGFDLSMGLQMPMCYKGLCTEAIYDKIYGEPMSSSYFMDLVNNNQSKETDRTITSVLYSADRATTSVKAFNHMCGEFKDTFDLVMCPKLPWEKLLYKYSTDYFNEDYSYSKPNRRYADIAYLPSLAQVDESFSDFNCYIDISGSVTAETVGKFSYQINCVRKRLEIKTSRICSFSMSINSVDCLIEGNNKTPNLKSCTSEGGTEIAGVIEDINKTKPKVAVIFTDGYFHHAPIDKAKYPIIWCIFDNKNFKPTKGKVIELPKGI